MKLALIIVVLGLGAMSTVSFGCVSGAPVPADKLARSEAAVRGAQEIGAERNSIGAPHLQKAREEFAEGKKLVIEGDQERATMFLLRAEADAELAMNITREATALADAQKTRDEAKNLRMSLSK